MSSFVLKCFLFAVKGISPPAAASSCGLVKFSISSGKGDDMDSNDKFGSLFENVSPKGHGKVPKQTFEIRRNTNSVEEIPEEFEYLFENLPSVSRKHKQSYEQKRIAKSIFQSITVPEYIMNTTAPRIRARSRIGSSCNKKKPSSLFLGDSEQYLWDIFEKDMDNVPDGNITVSLTDQMTTLSKKKLQNSTEFTTQAQPLPNHTKISITDGSIDVMNVESYKEYMRLVEDVDRHYTDKPLEIYENSCIVALNDLYEMFLNQDFNGFIYSQRQVIERQLSIYEYLLRHYDLADATTNIESNINEKAAIFLKALRMMNYANHPRNIRIMDIFKVDGLLNYMNINENIEKGTDITVYYPIESTLPVETPLKNWYIEPSAQIHVLFIKICQLVGGFKYSWQYYRHYLMPTMIEAYDSHIDSEQHRAIIVLLLNSQTAPLISSEQCHSLTDLYIKYGGEMTEDMTLAILQVHYANRELNHLERIFDLYIRIPTIESLVSMSLGQTLYTEPPSIETIITSTKLLIECYIESFYIQAVYCTKQIYNRLYWLEKVISIVSIAHKENRNMIFKVKDDLLSLDSERFIMKSSEFRSYLERFTSIAKQDDKVYARVKEYLDRIQGLTMYS